MLHRGRESHDFFGLVGKMHFIFMENDFDGLDEILQDSKNQQLEELAKFRDKWHNHCNNLTAEGRLSEKPVLN